MSESVYQTLLWVIAILGIVGLPAIIMLVYAWHVGQNTTTSVPIDADSRIETSKRLGEVARGERHWCSCTLTRQKVR